MPELPEVELVARSLNKILRQREIAGAKLLRLRLAPNNDPNEFSRLLTGAKITFVHRRGKYVLFDLNNGHTLITHLRMSGKFLLLSADSDEPKFTHAVFYLKDGTRLIFQDQRHFGFMKIVETTALDVTKEIAKLAPEPFSASFSPEYLHSVLRISRRSLKEFLLDQTKVCGLGNIYASEVMFLASLSPKTNASRVSLKKARTLYLSILQVLGEAVELSASFRIDPENIGGSIYGPGAEATWRVYGREGEPCSTCEEPILRLKQAGRSTYYCRKCQRR